MSTNIEFAELVLKMLDQQQAYFKSRDPVALIKSKELEREVRKQAQAILDTQEKLL